MLITGENIYLSALACADVYRGYTGFREGPLHAISEIRDEETDTHARVYTGGPGLIIAIQGTKELADWRTNVQVRKRNRFGMRMHRGFAKAAQSIEYDVVGALVEYDECPIIITGHSLGGAVAVGVALAVQEFLRSAARPQKVALITFGQPKVATAWAVAKHIAVPYTRVVNGSDLVPRRPNLPVIYGHGGSLHYIDNYGAHHLSPSAWMQAKDRVFTGRERVSDHSIDNYIRHFSTYRPKSAMGPGVVEMNDYATRSGR